MPHRELKLETAVTGEDDPFTKRIKAFMDVGIVKYSKNEGVLEMVK